MPKLICVAQLKDGEEKFVGQNGRLCSEYPDAWLCKDQYECDDLRQKCAARNQDVAKIFMVRHYGLNTESRITSFQR